MSASEPCGNCRHNTNHVACVCACHAGKASLNTPKPAARESACVICRRPEYEHRDRSGHLFVAVKGEPPHRAAWSGNWRDEDNAPAETIGGQAEDVPVAAPGATRGEGES